MNIIILADGTRLPGSGSLNGESVWVWTKENDLVKLFNLFNDPKKTAVIRFVLVFEVEIDGEEQERETELLKVEGFTRLTDLKVRDDGEINIRLRKA